MPPAAASPLVRAAHRCLPDEPRRAFATGVRQLQAHLGVAVAVREIDDALPRVDVLGCVHPRAAGCDARRRRDVGHFGHHQPGAANGARTEVHEVPIIGGAVVGEVLAHCRHHDAIRQQHVAQSERCEHGRRDCCTAAFRRAGRLRALSGVWFRITTLGLGSRDARRQAPRQRRHVANGDPTLGCGALGEAVVDPVDILRVA